MEWERGLQKANEDQGRAPISLKAYLEWERGLQKANKEQKRSPIFLKTDL